MPCYDPPVTEVFRTDASPIGNVQRTPQGGIRVDAKLTRTGVFVYRNPDGTPRREYRPPDEVFHEDSLASLRAAPVTNLHPPEGEVTSANWRKRTVGHLAEDVRQDGTMIGGTVYVQDADTVKLVEQRERSETSAGYRAVLDWSPGTTPEGERYDAIQRQIRYNHVALVPRGRAGREVALRLDGHEDLGDPHMKIEIIGGTEYEVGTPAHTKARTEADKAAQVRQDAESAKDGRIAALEAELTQLRQDLEEAPAKLAEAAKVRAAVVEVAKRAGVVVREDQDDEAIKRAVVAKMAPEIKLDGRDAAFVAGAFEVASSRVKTDSAALGRKLVETRNDAPAQPVLPADVAARQKMIERGRSMKITG